MRIEGVMTHRQAGWIVGCVIVVAWIATVIYGAAVFGRATYERKRIQGVDCIVGTTTKLNGVALSCDWTTAEVK
jgi:hypothetical protein